MTLLAIENLEVSFPVRSAILRRRIGAIHALRGVSLSVEPGETVAIVGESGSGKTTMARAVARLVRPTGGSVKLDGDDLLAMNAAQLRRARRKIQMVFQNPYSSLNRRHRVGEIIAEPLRVHGVGDRHSRRQRAHELLERVGLGRDAANHYTTSFSGGQRQRIAIARALALEPKLIICDEPVSALDISVQAQILNLLMQLKSDLGLSLLFVTHDLGVVNRIADRVAVMHAGRIVEMSPPETFFREPAHPYSKALVSAVPRPSGPRNRIRLVGDPPSPLSEPRGCLFAGRCAGATDLCRSDDPVLRFTNPLQQAACHFA
jgi:peptide/nickel transport system ATP-binding protein/oligopeptide transport system ATP-binding protein